MFTMHGVFAQPTNSGMNSQLLIAAACDEVKQLLLEKNAKYGDSALNPTRIFSKASAVEQLLVRIDDKLSRIQKGAGLIGKDEDVVNDLIGYLFLLKIALGPQGESGQPVEPNNSDYIVKFENDDPWDGTDIDNPYDYLHYAAMDR